MARNWRQQSRKFSRTKSKLWTVGNIFVLNILLRYADNAKRMSKMLAKKPFSSREILIKHVEFAAEFGKMAQMKSRHVSFISGTSSALRPQSVDMSFIEYHNLDVIVLLVPAVLFVVFVVILLSKLAAKILSCFGVGKVKTAWEYRVVDWAKYQEVIIK